MDLGFRFAKPTSKDNLGMDKYKKPLNQTKINKPNILVNNGVQRKVDVDKKVKVEQREDEKEEEKRTDKIKKYKKGEAPKDQFKRFVLDLQNVFFEDSEQVKQLQNIKKARKWFFVLWIFLSLSYFLISRIKPFEGVCPKGATCLVFARCNDGFELNEEGTECVLSRQIIQQIQNICRNKITSLHLEYGQSDCNSSLSNQPPTLNLESFLDQFESDEFKYTHEKIEAFFQNSTNQETLQFKIENRFDGSHIIPTTKQYNTMCSIRLHFTDANFLLKFFGGILCLIAILWIIKKRKQNRIPIQIYEYLKEKLKQENPLNINHSKKGIQDQFGKITEEIWNKVNEHRSRQQEIGFYEDDFLFWKMA